MSSLIMKSMIIMNYMNITNIENSNMNIMNINIINMEMGMEMDVINNMDMGHVHGLGQEHEH